ncbi:MAG: hypothetical protein ACYC4Q_03240 [Victivallaceae bacterium]
MKQFANMVRVGSVAIAMFAGNALLAEEAAPLSAAWGDFSGKALKNLTVAESEQAVILKGSDTMLSKASFNIDPEKTYKISGSFKLAPDSKPSKFYFGIMPLNDKGQQIFPVYVNTIEGTETELAADCNLEDTVIKIKNGDKWKDGKFNLIAFNIDDSGKKADLPNTDISSMGIAKVEKNGDAFDVTLTAKCGKKYAAGTKIREHMSGGTFIYLGAANKDATPEWTESAKTFKKEDCWPGTCSAKIIILANYGGKPDQAMMIKDIKLEEVK